MVAFGESCSGGSGGGDGVPASHLDIEEPMVVLVVSGYLVFGFCFGWLFFFRLVVVALNFVHDVIQPRFVRKYRTRLFYRIQKFDFNDDAYIYERRLYTLLMVVVYM